MIAQPVSLNELLGRDIVVRAPDPLTTTDQVKLAAIIAILRPDWHPDYVAQVVRRYMVYRRVSLADAMRAVALGFTHPVDAVANGKLAKRYRDQKPE